MDKDQVIEVMKKNAVSISLGVAALIALVVTQFFIRPMFSELDQRVDARAAKAQTASSLLTADRPDVQVDPSSAASQERSLQMFPTSAVIQAGRETMDQVELQAGSVLAVAVDANRQVPLLQPNYDTAAEAWPLERTRDDLARAEYQRAYRAYVNADGAVSEGRFPADSLPGRMNATRPPSREEANNAIESLEASMESQEERDSSGRPVAEDYEERLTEARAKLVTQLKFARARNHMFYLDSLDVHDLATAEESTAADIFSAQMELWVQENILTNLYRANEEELQSLPPEDRHLLNAPVKHIVGIEVHDLLDSAAMIEQTQDRQTSAAPPGGGFDMGTGDGFGPAEGMGLDPGLEPGFGPAEGMASPNQSRQPAGGRSGGRGGTGTTGADQPGGLAGAARSGGQALGQQDEDLPEIDLPADPASTVERQFAYSVTGRVPHTPVYDLMRFNLTFRCEASAVPYVLQQLQAGSLITVLNVDVRTVDMAVAASQGYVYGDEPVVELDLQGEMVFLRAWTADLMPSVVKRALIELSGGEVDDGGGDSSELDW